MLNLCSKIKVKRSPARVCWHVLYNGELLGTRNTRAEANALKDELLCTLMKQSY